MERLSSHPDHEAGRLHAAPVGGAVGDADYSGPRLGIGPRRDSRPDEGPQLSMQNRARAAQEAASSEEDESQSLRSFYISQARERYGVGDRS
eukprot:tig00020909_g15345.t1